VTGWTYISPNISKQRHERQPVAHAECVCPAMLLTISTTLGVRSGATIRMSHPRGSQPCDSSSVHEWLDGVVIKHGLCPWAPLSLQNDGLRIVAS
jgi:hypothetical protein